ncbi:MAG: CmpA/NrtA family ABC transporter substrate-binding protein [Pseudomonadota bacterium]
MKLTDLKAGFIPLVDAAPFIVARELGFAEEEGIALHLAKAPSWSTLRDWVAIGQIDAAHMLSPVPVAAALGLGGIATRLNALSVLSVNGNVIGVSTDLAQRMRDAGHRFDFQDPKAAGPALMAAVDGRLRIGVPFPFSMHAELLYYWLGTMGVQAPQGLDVRTIPPPLMADAMARGEIDAFCVGEPWGSIAVDTNVGALLLPGNAIWARAPEKVLAVRESWAEDAPELAHRLVRALWRAGRWLGLAANQATASEILSRPEYLDVSAEVLERSLSGRMVISPQGDLRVCEAMIAFHAGAATFPWRSQAAWIAERLAARTGLDRETIPQAVQVFRADIYRQALAPLHVDLPGASEKLEGAIEVPTEVASASGTLILAPDQFFDGKIYDPSTDE